MERSVRDWGGVIIAFLLVIVVNGLANALPIGGQTTGEISAKYPSLFTPAGFTFSIWGVIYFGLALFVVYQALPAQRDNVALEKVSTLFVLNGMANAAWIFAWHFDLLLLSLLIMVGILTTLILIYRSLGIARKPVSAGQRWLVHLPFSLYTGWITVATIANLSAVQTVMGWDDLGLDAITWTLIKLAVAGTIGATVVLRRRDIAFVLVVAWAAIGIAVRQEATPAVAGAAGMLAMLAVLLALAEAIRMGVRR